MKKVQLYVSLVIYAKNLSLIEKNVLNNCIQKSGKIINLVCAKHRFKSIIKLVANKYY